jgi:hypothetical protein
MVRVADVSFCDRRRPGNRLGHRAELCANRCSRSGRRLRHGGGERMRMGRPAAMPEAAVSGRARLACANLDGPSENYGTHDAGGLQNLHRPQPRGTVPERTLHACVMRHAKGFWWGMPQARRRTRREFVTFTGAVAKLRQPCHRFYLRPGPPSSSLTDLTLGFHWRGSEVC